MLIALFGVLAGLLRSADPMLAMALVLVGSGILLGFIADLLRPP